MKPELTHYADQALNGPDLSLRAQVKCLRRLYRTCGSHGLLPEALKVSVCYDHTVYPIYSGGYADVWKGEYCGQDVAVKVIRTYSKGNVQKMISVSSWLCSSSAHHTTDDVLCRGTARKS